MKKKKKCHGTSLFLCFPCFSCDKFYNVKVKISFKLITFV